MDKDPDPECGPWMPIRIRSRQNDAIRTVPDPDPQHWSYRPYCIARGGGGVYLTFSSPASYTNFMYIYIQRGVGRDDELYNFTKVCFQISAPPLPTLNVSFTEGYKVNFRS